MRFGLLTEERQIVGRCFSPRHSESPAGADIESGCLRVNCVFLAFIHSFPGRGPWTVSDVLPCAAGDQRCRPSLHTPGRRNNIALQHLPHSPESLRQSCSMAGHMVRLAIPVLIRLFICRSKEGLRTQKSLILQLALE